MASETFGCICVSIWTFKCLKAVLHAILFKSFLCQANIKGYSSTPAARSGIYMGLSWNGYNSGPSSWHRLWYRSRYNFPHFGNSRMDQLMFACPTPFFGRLALTPEFCRSFSEVRLGWKLGSCGCLKLFLELGVWKKSGAPI